MMPFADFTQVAVAGEHLAATRCGYATWNGMVLPKGDGGRHGKPPRFEIDAYAHHMHGAGAATRF
jgi:hypothetical protein